VSTDYVPGQNDPNQEPIKTTLTYGEAVLEIARRVAFPTEETRDAVYAAIEAEHGEKPPADTESDGDAQPPAPDSDPKSPALKSPGK